MTHLPDLLGWQSCPMVLLGGDVTLKALPLWLWMAPPLQVGWEAVPVSVPFSPLRQCLCLYNPIIS